MTVYRRKPTTVRAARWDGSISTDLAGVLAEAKVSDDGGPPARFHRGQLRVRTIDGNEVTVPRGAYLVLDAEGFPYPCDGELFDATHELEGGTQGAAASGALNLAPGAPASQVARDLARNVTDARAKAREVSEALARDEHAAVDARHGGPLHHQPARELS